MLSGVILVEKDVPLPIDHIGIALAIVEGQGEIAKHHVQRELPQEIAFAAVPQPEGHIHIKNLNPMGPIHMGIDKTVGSAIRERLEGGLVPQRLVRKYSAVLQVDPHTPTSLPQRIGVARKFL